ncbi:hypothetical protein Nepgr_006650 [Nepenthes gracilis]|uniref:Uncharacterized protein n=1 Tax=Nepenthes gracilis TaxID=150966 RepID=A0AAD3S5I8_NEPGR|nr:hypothetical protein Nepgr_006650 [Nepenthes gracilis]
MEPSCCRRSGGIPESAILVNPMLMLIQVAMPKSGSWDSNVATYFHSFSCGLETASLSDWLDCGPCLIYFVGFGAALLRPSLLDAGLFRAAGLRS